LCSVVPKIRIHRSLFASFIDPKCVVSPSKKT
jgi:hypothetical protein